VTFRDLRAGRETAGRVEIEIGCGNGHFLVEYGSRNPSVQLIGIEVKEKRCQKAAEKARKRRLPNVSIVRGAAEGFLSEVPASEVDAFHIYFPDPWPKARHRKRRFLCRENLGRLHDCLRPGGKVFFSTDFFDYYLQAKVLFLLHGGFTLIPDPVPEEAFASVYARKFSGAMKAVHLLTAVKLVNRSGGPGEG
jgi:tRNA (guanine-N7-)-methyltransferase